MLKLKYCFNWSVSYKSAWFIACQKVLLLYHQLSQQLSLFQFVFKQKQNIMYQSWSHASSAIHTKPVRVQNKLSYSAVIL